MGHIDKPGDHTGKILIIINGTNYELEINSISFEEVVKFAFPDTPDNIFSLFVVQYEKSNDEKPDGFLLPGSSLKIKTDTIFEVSRKISIYVNGTEYYFEKSQICYSEIVQLAFPNKAVPTPNEGNGLYYEVSYEKFDGSDGFIFSNDTCVIINQGDKFDVTPDTVS